MQKRSVILFAILFSLFFPPSLLALDLSTINDQSQGNIIQLLERGIQSCFLAKEDVAYFKQNLKVGVCFGLSAVWLYSKWLQFEHPEKISLYNADWYQNTVTDILGNWSDCSNIQKFASSVKKFHGSQHGTFENEMNQLNAGGEKIQKEYSIASLFTLGQLQQLLKEIIIYDHKLVFIHSQDHTTALLKDRDSYYYFNPNSMIGERKRSSINDLAELIFDVYNFDYTKPSPLAFEIFSFDKQIQNYPRQQEILKRINPSLVPEINYADEKTGLHLAAQWNCVESIYYFLSNGIDINKAENNGRTALMLAAQNGNLEVVRLLLKNQADINKVSNDGHTVLMSASATGRLEVVQLLLENKADINRVNNYGWIALMYAAGNGHLEVVRLLLENNADINKATNNGWTSLMIAATRGHLEVVLLLLENNADFSLIDKEGKTALTTAENLGHFKIAEAIRAKMQQNTNKESHIYASETFDTLLDHDKEIDRIISDTDDKFSRSRELINQASDNDDVLVQDSLTKINDLETRTFSDIKAIVQGNSEGINSKIKQISSITETAIANLGNIEKDFFINLGKSLVKAGCSGYEIQNIALVTDKKIRITPPVLYSGERKKSCLLGYCYADSEVFQEFDVQDPIYLTYDSIKKYLLDRLNDIRPNTPMDSLVITYSIISQLARVMICYYPGAEGERFVKDYITFKYKFMQLQKFMQRHQ